MERRGTPHLGLLARRHEEALVRLSACRPRRAVARRLQTPRAAAAGVAAAGVAWVETGVAYRQQAAAAAAAVAPPFLLRFPLPTAQPRACSAARGTCAAVDGRSGPIVLQRCLDRTSRVRKCRVCLDAPPRLLWHLMSVHDPAETAAAAAVGVGLLMAAPHSLWMRRGFPRPASADRTRAHGQRGSLDVLRRRLMLVPWGLLHGGVEGVHGCEGG